MGRKKFIVFYRLQVPGAGSGSHIGLLARLATGKPVQRNNYTARARMHGEAGAGLAHPANTLKNCLRESPVT